MGKNSLALGFAVSGWSWIASGLLEASATWFALRKTLCAVGPRSAGHQIYFSLSGVILICELPVLQKWGKALLVGLLP